jgi:hypothetical protein
MGNVVMISDTFGRRFAELEASFQASPFKSYDDEMYDPDGQWKKWATSAENLIVAVFGKDSPHNKNFVEAFRNCHGYDHQVKPMHAVFSAAKEDFEGGYVFNVELQVSGEVFGDFIVLAKQALAEAQKDVAAVLACAALEDALKRYAIVSGLSVSDKTMAEVVNALKSAGLVAGPQKSLLDAMPRLRNAAMHADWSKISGPDVSSVIGFTEQLLLSKFGGS